MGWKRMILGDKMPDKNDPEYRERYEKEVKAGARFAKAIKLDKAAAWLQDHTERSPRLVLGLLFGLVGLCVLLNIVCLARVLMLNENHSTPTSVVKRQENVYKTIKSKRLRDELERNDSVRQLGAPEV